MKKLSDILEQATEKLVIEADASNNSNAIIPPFNSDGDRLGSALQKLDQIGEMANDIYNTVSHLEDIDAETDASLTAAYNSLDNLYAKIDEKYDIVPLDIEDEYDIEEEVELLDCFDTIVEKLSPDSPASEWIDDFIKSDAPQFKGKSKKERIKMALGAYYGAQKDEELDEAKYDSDFPSNETYELNQAQTFWYKLNKGAVSVVSKEKYMAALQKAIRDGDVMYSKDEFLAKVKNIADRYDLKFKDKSRLSVWLTDTGAKFSGEGNVFSRKGGALLPPEAKASQVKLAEEVELHEAADSTVLGLIKKAGFVDMPLRDDPFPAPHAAKKWGIKMRAGKWADTVVGQYKDNSLHSWFIYANDELQKYGSDEMFVKALKKMALGEEFELEESVNLPKIKELVSLALIDEKDVPATVAALKATQSDKALTPVQTKLLGNLAVMLTNVILGDTSALSSVKRASKE